VRCLGAIPRWVRGSTLLVGLLLACGVAASLVTASFWRAAVQSQSRNSFQAEAASVGLSVTTALRRIDDLTVGVRTLIGQDTDVTNSQLAAWYRSVGAKERYPGAQGAGFVELVAASDLGRYVHALEADPPPGFPKPTHGLRITPPGKRPHYCLIRLALSNVIPRLVPGGLGYDVCALAGSRAFLASPESGAVKAVSATMPPLGQILIVSAPVYRGGDVPASTAARRERMLGWTAAVFRLSSVLSAARAVDPAIGVSVGRSDATIPKPGQGPPVASMTRVASAGPHPLKGAFSRRFTLDADGRWVVTVSKTPHYGALLSPKRQGLLVLLGGILVTLLLGGLVHVLLRGRTSALRLVAEKTEELRHQALHDPLTGLPNRALVIDRTEQAIARCRRDQHALAALFVDLDGFKDVNDTLGHAGGDALLRAIGRRLASVLRDADTIGRLGGDEFIVLLESEPFAARPELVAERLLAALREPFEADALQETPFAVTASIGIAVGDGELSADDLLRNADIALYEAKAAGRGRFVVFRGEMQRAVQDRLELERTLRGALEAGQLFLEYQPTFDLDDDGLTGVEALLRWRHPSRGVIPPVGFIGLAEETGLIAPIGRWVLDTACAQGAVWHRQGYEIEVSVNISPRQLDDPRLRDSIARTLEARRFDPAFLILEVTETALMHDPELTAARLGELKQLGIRVAIDDFGTGYSSLAYLRQLPVDILKIDRSFVATIGESPESRAIVHTLVELGRALRLETIAEGIEDSAQLAAIRAEGCSRGQGFLLARPLAAPALDTLLEQRRPIPQRARPRRLLRAPRQASA
jgi:diguanylate cyclase (GGDEF)-like protein